MIEHAICAGKCPFAELEVEAHTRLETILTGVFTPVLAKHTKSST